MMKISFADCQLFLYALVFELFCLTQGSERPSIMQILSFELHILDDAFTAMQELHNAAFYTPRRILLRKGCQNTIQKVRTFASCQHGHLRTFLAVSSMSVLDRLCDGPATQSEVSEALVAVKAHITSCVYHVHHCHSHLSFVTHTANKVATRLLSHKVTIRAS